MGGVARCLKKISDDDGRKAYQRLCRLSVGGMPAGSHATAWKTKGQRRMAAAAARTIHRAKANCAVL